MPEQYIILLKRKRAFLGDKYKRYNGYFCPALDAIVVMTKTVQLWKIDREHEAIRVPGDFAGYVKLGKRKTNRSP